MPKHVVLLFLFLSSIWANATHNRAGEITYTHVSGFTYEIKIVTYTKSSVEADREWILVNYGDSPFCTYNDSIQRTDIFELEDYDDTQRNTYIGYHTYAGIGSFDISVLDPNRNEGVNNLLNSVNTPFYITTELIIGPLTGHNSSAVLLNPPVGNCCLNQLWVHNPAAYDPDGDILTYSLVACRGEDCDFIPGYQHPDDWTDDTSDTFEIDPNTGTVVWDVPTDVGEYNFAILIEEHREVNGQLIKVGSVIRDMQINVQFCDNEPPVLSELVDTCILINTPLTLEVEAIDPNGDPVDLIAVGGPLTEVENTALFNPSNGVFTWIPDCEEVRNEPYQVVFIAEDDSPQPDLQDIETVNIRVIAPAVENPAAEAIANSISLTWDPHECLNHFTEEEWEDFNYKIYRRSGLYGFDPDHCETGVPTYTGYQLIGTVNGLDANSFLDTESVNYGGTYCYMIVTCWPDGAESLASEEVCAEIIKDVPVMTHVTVLQTDQSVGIDSVGWSPPTELDTDVYPGPYQYKLYWSEGFDAATELIYQSNVSADLMWEDTLYIHNNIDTETTPNAYKVEFYSGNILVATSNVASSVFVELIPDDNELTLDIQHDVPWTNEEYEVYRFNGTDYELIGTTTEQVYVDSNLVNSVTYCYYVRSIGTYDAQFVVDPLLNNSQEVCGFPVDLTPPCPPELTIEPECEEEQSTISWTNPNWTCADDVLLFQLYYAPTPDDDFEMIETFVPNGNLTFTFNADGELGTIAGCFYITALDSLAPGLDGELTRNESDPSNIICIDNCPTYELPNIFTPNGDDQNDTFHPFYPYRYIESVDVAIFNRWGGLVFETTDPEIGWKGEHKDTGQICPDGTYYYTAIVNTIRLEGIVTFELSGYVQLSGGVEIPSE